jgi:hypothetical protein
MSVLFQTAEQQAFNARHNMQLTHTEVEFAALYVVKFAIVLQYLSMC